MILAERYEIQSEIGTGGMGMVYKGMDTQTKQPVAIKQLKSDIAQPEIIERFKREGEALRELNHPNIVKMVDALEHEGQHYLVMEYVSGGDLSNTSNLPIDRILAIAIDLADALTRAHKLGIVHRDLKPANVMLSDDGTLKLTDFGVARIQKADRVTDTGTAVGTLHYLSPESLDGKDVDARVDIWAFGVMLYEMLIGELPFQGDSLSSIVMAIMTKPVPDIEALRPDLPIELADLIYRMLERDRDARIRSVRIVGAELEAIQEGYDFDVDSISTPVKPSVLSSRFELSTDERLERPRHNLPASPTPFVGRDDELKQASDLLGVRIFVSYSRTDKQAMHDVIELLKHAHPDYYVWYDENIPGGTDWWDYILSEIRNSDICVYLLSDDSLQSEFCHKEINEAMRLDKPILPVAVRAETDLNFAPESMRSYLEKTQHVTIVDVPTDTVTRQLKLSLDHVLSTKDTKARLLTVMAPGGMGKTRFGLEVAERLLDNYADGAFLVELAPLDSIEQIIPAIADAVKFTFSGGQEPKQQLLDFFEKKSLLLIMDNFEHLIEGTAIVDEILKIAPNVQIIATSRTKLNLHGETVYPLPGLDFPDWDVPEDAMQYSAVKLFMQSARRARPGFELEADDLTHVAHICRMVHGMPLGIELAAAWLDTLDLEEIADEINESLDFLETEMTNVPERHRSIRAVFDYSWNLMDEKERVSFSKLSVFRGTFSRKAAQKITGLGLRQLTTLVNKSLLKRDNDTGNYMVHELLRQYAEEQLEDSGEAEAVRDAHSDYYLTALHKLTPDIKGAKQIETLEAIDGDMENIRTSMIHATKQSKLQVVEDALEAIWVYSMMRDRPIEINEMLVETIHSVQAQEEHRQRNDLLAYLLSMQGFVMASTDVSVIQANVEKVDGLISEETPEHIKYKAQLTRAFEYERVFEYGKVRAIYEEILPAIRKMGDTFWEMLVLFQYTWTYMNETIHSDWNKASELIEDLKKRLNEISTPSIRRRVFNYAAIIETKKNNNSEKAREYYLQSLEIGKQLGNPLFIAGIYNNIAITYLEIDGNVEKGTYYYEMALSTYRQTGQIGSIAFQLNNVAHLYFSISEMERCLDCAKELIEMSEGTGFVIPRYRGHFWAGRAYDHLGQFDKSETHWDAASQMAKDESLKISDEVKHFIHINQAIHYRLRGKFEQAYEELNSLMIDAEKSDDPLFLHFVEFDIGLINLLEGKFKEALGRIQKGLDYFQTGDASRRNMSIFAGTYAFSVIVSVVNNQLDGVKERVYLALTTELRQRDFHDHSISVLGAAYFLWKQDKPELGIEYASIIMADDRSGYENRQFTQQFLDLVKSDVELEIYEAAIERGKQRDIMVALDELIEMFKPDGEND